MAEKSKQLPEDVISTFTALLQHYGLFHPGQDPTAPYKVLCPFHGDKNASLGINIPQAYFYCYAGCGAQGSSLELYKEFWKLDHPRQKLPSDMYCLMQIRKIAHEGTHNNILISYKNDPSFVDTKLAIKEARDYYYNLPTPNWFRPTKEEAIAEETTECKLYMRKRGFTPRILKEAGAKPSLNANYPIILPLVENGIFRGYVMRTFDPEVEDARKYLYNRGFRRRNVLPGEYGRKGGRRRKDTVVLVEGYLDKLKANQMGIQDVAAVLGWKLAPKQIEKLQKAGITTLICATDNDEAGRKGYRYCKVLSKSMGFKVHRIHYPKGIKDMGDLRVGSQEAQTVLHQLNRIYAKLAAQK